MKYLLLVGALFMSHADAEAPLSDADKKMISTLKQRSSTSAESILFWSAEERRIGFREIRELAPTRLIERGEATYPLHEQPVDLSGISYSLGERTRTLQDFIDRPETIGLLVVHKDNIIFERYQAGNDKNSQWISFSVTKSVTSLLIGAAIKDGYIESVNEPAANYLPRLKGTVYETASIKDVLQMSSGAAWNEDYADPNSDVARAGTANGLGLVRYLADLEAVAKPGEVWNYNTGETNLAGQILRAAIGNNASSYLTRKIWQPFGMESNAHWMLSSPHGDETGGCCINATLRDYARIGIFAMNNGVVSDGSKVLPDNWMTESTSPSKGYPGYGYLWWLHGDGTYSARGIFGQYIFIDPANDIVIAMHNSANAAVGTELHEEVDLVWTAITEHLVR